MDILLVRSSSNSDSVVATVSKNLSESAMLAGKSMVVVDANDDFNFIKTQLLESACVFFVVPVFFGNTPIAFRNMVSRFSSVLRQIKSEDRKVALIACIAGNKEEEADGLVRQYKMILNFVSWQDIGIVKLVGKALADDLNDDDKILLQELVGKLG